MSEGTSRMAADLCNALGLKRCVSFKIEVDNETMIPMVTSVQYLGHDQFHALDKVLRQYRLELISETPLSTPDAEGFLDGRVHTFRLGSPSSVEQDATERAAGRAMRAAHSAAIALGSAEKATRSVSSAFDPTWGSQD